MPEIIATWWPLPTLITIGGILVGLVRSYTRIEEQTGDNTRDITELRAATTEFRDFRIEFLVWSKGHEREERTRSKRMDAIVESMGEIAKGVGTTAERISRIEGRINGAS